MSAFGPASADSAAGPPAALNVSAATKSRTCPSRDFAAFFYAFSERSVLQRRYTRLPVEYGVFDANLIGTDEEDRAFKTKMIDAFEKIPAYRSDNGGIFPNKMEMKKAGLESKVITNENAKTGKDLDPEQNVRDRDSATVTLFMPDTGFRIHYRFRKTQGCWFLYGISDRSI